MSSPSQTETDEDIDYPDDNGERMAENTLQFQWIVTLHGNLDVLYSADPNVIVAGDLLWYPVLGDPTLSAAPDTMVVFGRPKGYRGSYMQWREDGIAPQVVFEILSPSNRPEEMEKKFEFYTRYKVEEYYIVDPYDGQFYGWLRQKRKLVAIEKMDGWISPRLGIRFEMSDEELVIYRPDGQRFLSFVEIMQSKEASDLRAEQARQQVEAAQREVESAQREVESAQRDAEQAVIEKEQALLEAKRLADKLRSLGIDPEK